MHKPPSCKSRLMLAAAVILAGILSAQSPGPRPEFEVATIRLNIDGGPCVFNGMKSLGTFSSQNQTLRNLIQEAYGVPSGRRNWLPFIAAGQGVPILGGPAWIGQDRWDITAKWNAAHADAPATVRGIETAQSQMEMMLRVLLEQRFQLKLHRETQDLPVYELTLANPAKLKQANCTIFDPENIPTPAPGQPPPDYCGASREGRKGVDWTLNGTGMKMTELADALSFLIGSRTVIDKTGFTGTFDAHLRWTPGPGEFGATDAGASPDDAGESIFTVLQEQLGLRLKSARGPVEVIVVESAERPSPN